MWVSADTHAPFFCVERASENAQAAYISPDQRAALEDQPFFSRANEDDFLLDETPMDAVMFEQADAEQQQVQQDEEEQQDEAPLLDEAQDFGAEHRGPLIGGSLPSPLQDSQHQSSPQG